MNEKLKIHEKVQKSFILVTVKMKGVELLVI